MGRVTKEPEVRKQEILEAAMILFYEKGYDKTKMSDIAEKIGVAQGLCYRYFSSKEALFDSAIEQYAHMQTIPMQKLISNNSLSLKQKLELFPDFDEIENQNDIFYQVFHDENSKKIHEQLSLRICEIMVPYVADALQAAYEKGETSFNDFRSAASFFTYGQLGILLDATLTKKEKMEHIRNYLSLFLSD